MEISQNLTFEPGPVVEVDEVPDTYSDDEDVTTSEKPTSDSLLTKTSSEG